MSRSISFLLTWGCNNIFHSVRRLFYFLHPEQVSHSLVSSASCLDACWMTWRQTGWSLRSCMCHWWLMVLLLCRGTSTRRRTRRCCTEWRVCPVWAGCWRRASTRTNWSQNGRLLRRCRVDLFCIWRTHRMFSCTSDKLSTAHTRLTSEVRPSKSTDVFDDGFTCVCLWVAAVGLGHVDANAGAEERQRVHHPRRVPIVPLRNHRPQHERLLSCKFWGKRTVFSLSKPQIYK